jgi:hypothetical protein
MTSEGKGKKGNSDTTPKTEAAPASKAGGEVPEAKADGGEASSPTNYSRGEGQKPVSKAYRDNWEVIFGKRGKR